VLALEKPGPDLLVAMRADWPRFEKRLQELAGEYIGE
jgi:deoxyadenosine/deoxycytidine kinase